MHKRVIDFSVGLFVLAGFAALVMLAFRVGNLASSSQGAVYTISANFENIGGLTAKAPVRLAGVTIGRVVNISVDPDQYNARVVMSIDAQHDNLPLDTSASIFTAGLLGANRGQLATLSTARDQRAANDRHQATPTHHDSPPPGHA